MKTQSPSATSSRRRPGLRATFAAVAAALTFAVVTATPAQAATPRPTTGDGTATITSATTVLAGSTITFDGAGFGVTGGVGQTLTVKIDDGAVTQTGGTDATVAVKSDGTFSGSLTLPTDIAVGQHWLRFLGSTPVVSQISGYFNVVTELPKDATATATVTNGGRGAATGSVTVTVAGTGFTAAETLTAKVDGTAKDWTVGSGTTATTSSTVAVAADGSVSGAKLVYAAGTLPAGSHTLVLTRSTAGANPVSVDFTVVPTTTFSSLTAGSAGTLTLGNLKAGVVISKIVLGDVVFTGLPVTADSTGAATVTYTIGASATLGTQTLTLTQTGPAATYTATAKVSPSTAAVNQGLFTQLKTTKNAIAQGLYQSAYSAASDALFVTSATTTTTSTIYRLDPDTLAVEKSVTPAFVSGTSGALWAAYGVGVDDKNGTVWVTNTRQNTIAVYKQSDLSLVKQFPADTITHSRDVVVDPTLNKVFVSSASEGTSGDGSIQVYDGTSLALIGTINTGARTDFSPVSLAIDTATHTLFTVSLSTNEAMSIDVSGSTYTPKTIALDLPASARVSGVDYDPATKRLFVASQGADNLLVIDAATGKELADVPTGAGALNVQYDAVNGLTYVANFAGTTVTVVNNAYKVVGNLTFSRPNHIETDGQGSVYVVNKADSNQVLKLTPKAITGAKPTVVGRAAVGSTVSADVDDWDNATSYAYQWLRNGTAIKGATTSTYAVAAADKGTKLSVKVTGTGVLTASKTSAARTVAAGTLTAPKPSISGTAKSGRTLKVVTGTWTTGTTLTYRWYVDGEPIAAVNGGTKSSLVVKSKWKGHRLSVRVTGAKSGYTTLTRRSDNVTVK